MQVHPCDVRHTVISHKNVKHKDINQYLCWCKSPHVTVLLPQNVSFEYGSVRAFEKYLNYARVQVRTFVSYFLKTKGKPTFLESGRFGPSLYCK